METVNKTPFVFETLPLPLAQDRFQLLIILKCTFSYNSFGDIQVADDQKPLAYADEPDLLTQALAARVESDLVPFKKQADICVVSQVYAPNGAPVRLLDASIKVGGQEHTVRVFGDRKWIKTGLFGALSRSHPEPFTQMPLSYANAYGGVDEETGEIFLPNPIGKGFQSQRSKSRVEGKSLPNLENPRQLIDQWTDRPTPALFGPVCRSFPPRLNFTGTFDESWQKTRAPAMPEDFKAAFYNGAVPELQIPGYLLGNEPILLTHLSPQGSDRFAVPMLKPQFFITTQAEKKQLFPALDTLVCWPEEKTFTCVWRSRIEVADAAASDVKSVALELDI